MGTLATIGQKGPDNLKHVIFNNGAHDSVGGQPTDARSEKFNFGTIALGCGYREVRHCSVFFARNEACLFRNVTVYFLQ